MFDAGVGLCPHALTMPSLNMLATRCLVINTTVSAIDCRRCLFLPRDHSSDHMRLRSMHLYTYTCFWLLVSSSSTLAKTASLSLHTPRQLSPPSHLPLVHDLHMAANFLRLQTHLVLALEPSSPPACPISRSIA